MLAIALPMMLAALASVDPRPPNDSALPREVQAFVARRTACDHWSGEFAGDRSARDRQVAAEQRKLGCGRLERDERRLSRRYRGAPAVFRALAERREDIR